MIDSEKECYLYVGTWEDTFNRLYGKVSYNFCHQICYHVIKKPPFVRKVSSGRVIYLNFAENKDFKLRLLDQFIEILRDSSFDFCSLALTSGQSHRLLILLD